MESKDTKIVLDNQLALAADYLQQADYVLVCAGAGASFSPGNNVYSSRDDFLKHYPQMSQWGYSSAYECMGLHMDPHVPEPVKWGWYCRHWTNMRFKFPVPAPYEDLKRILDSKTGDSYFVLTSNVDGCFERSGLDPNRIYTPQGDMATLQCLQACRPDAVWPSKPVIDSLVPLVDPVTGAIPRDRVPTCPHCQGPVFANLRGGDWFLHHKALDDTQDRLRSWVEKIIASEEEGRDGSDPVAAVAAAPSHRGSPATLCVLEIGVGQNTPIVTKYPVEGIARELGHRACLVRVNPTARDAAVPSDLSHALPIVAGTEALAPIADVVVSRTTAGHRTAGDDDGNGEGDGAVAKAAASIHPSYAPTRPTDPGRVMRFDWRDLLDRLRG